LIGEVIGGLFFIVVSAILINGLFPPKVKDEVKENIHNSEHNGHDSNESLFHGLRLK
jgi:hypothetical protein